MFLDHDRLRLMAITDRKRFQGSLLDTVQELVKGGVSAVVLREKDLTPRELYELARPLRQVCYEAGVLFLINRSVEVAMAVVADGVHLGRDAVPIAAARMILGHSMVVGVSTHNREELQDAYEHKADYAFVSPIFQPFSKQAVGETLGVNGLRELVREFELPLVALGGMTPLRAAECYKAGAAGVAAIDALGGAVNPRAAAVDFSTI